MAPRTPRTAGRKLRLLLDKALPTGSEWTEQELTVLDLLESSADRLEPLKVLLQNELDRPEPSTRRVSELAAECRLLERQIATMSATLDPSGQGKPEKSWTHQRAAGARWHRGSA